MEVTLVGQTLRAGLQVRERLADTPLGELYRAEYPSGVEVAILSLRTAASDSEALDALRQRLSQAIQIQHPNVAAIYDLNETPDGLIYVVAECLEGELLSETLARRGALPLEEALEIFRQAAAGLQGAHAAGSIHGNLSPGTILLSPSAGRTLVKLVGFAQETTAAPQSDTFVEANRTAQYASPERLAGRDTDQRSDVYSLGAVLHHLLTGASPSRLSNGGQIPDNIRPVLVRALAPSADQRYQTVTEFVAAVDSSAELENELTFDPAEPEYEEVLEPATEPEYEAATDPPAEQEYEPAVDPAVEAEYVAAFDPQAESVVHLIPKRRTRSRRKLARLGAVIAAMVALTAGLWLLWGRPRLTLDALSRTRTEESGAVLRAAPESTSASSSGALAPVQRPAPSAPRATASAASDSVLVDLRSVDSTIQVDLRYATANNFTGAPLPGYEAQRALLRREVATALGRVQARVRGSGLGLRIFDAYRPLRASRAMVSWAESTGHQALLESGYIAERSRHNLGIAVDLTLVDLATGTEVPMGTGFDNFTPAAETTHVDNQALRNRQILAEAMTAEGFRPFGQAWWHFNYPLEGAVPLDRVIR